jgi:hypothetical protein
MKRYSLAVCILMLTAVSAIGQARMRKLSTSINHPSLNLYAPFVSSDGNTLMFISDNAEDFVLTPYYTFRQGSDWKEPQMLPKQLHTRLNFLRGYGLSADGKKLYISTVKQPSVGGYDIWMSDLKGSSWADPVNPGLPINTKSHEASASITTDGTVLYFMRCETMDQNNAGGCKIFTTTKQPNGEWTEPVMLPANINTGNSQTPRIMADSETLIFSSDKIPGGKGGMDLYMTRLTGKNTWSDPIALDFANTEGHDQYVSVTATSRYLLKDMKGVKKNEIVELLFPDELRPKAITKVEGKVSDGAGSNVNAYVSVRDLKTGKSIFNGRPLADGSFVIYLKEGSKYEVAVDPESSHISYFSKVIDLTEKVSQGEKLNVVLRKIEKGDSLELETVAFKSDETDLDLVSSDNELKKVVRLIESNPEHNFRINVVMTGYKEDSVQSSPELSEVVYDTLVAQYEIYDSVGQVTLSDTMEVVATYHNDRTEAQALKIKDYFVAKGIDASRISHSFDALPAEEKKIRVRVIVE